MDGYEDLERKHFSVFGKVLHFSKRSSEGTTICAPTKAILLFSFHLYGWTYTNEKVKTLFFFSISLDVPISWVGVQVDLVDYMLGHTIGFSIW